MVGFIDLVKARAGADKETIVLPESMDRGTWEAAEAVLKEDIANLIIIGTSEDIANHGKGLGISGAAVINPQTYEKTQGYTGLFIELRRSKGITPEKAKEIIIPDYAYYDCLIIKNEDVDGLVPGVCHSTADTLRPCLQVIRTKPGAKLVSAFFLMVIPDCGYGVEGTFIFADSGLNQSPNPEELVAVAKSFADSLELLVQKEAGVAILSHSTKDSAKHPDVDKVVEATRIAKEFYPEPKLDGELQLDAALVPEATSSKASGSEVAGKANILVFPDLDVGNVGYKLVQRLAKVETYGPVARGIVKPISDLSKGCCADGIVGVVAITAVQAQIE